MATCRHFELMFIAGKSQCGREILISERPITEQVIQIVFPFLQINLERFWLGLGFTNQTWIGPATPDIGKAADVTAIVIGIAF